ncbi:hypothetical protein EJ05DRAFT_385043 [Pseudovirgaria hyperparasitica]|uniref:Elongator complex protein 6 n=1 Tax=Pseudovirgaria hyperparasitica TaxID=470096 RepID=A0A6A6W2X5_9PEZI|nr:uncharacterized protein EJ05DRAFT_385043 [Pseudovirgaria hyperparasitica]KAF2757288.1 hypothetical protein EJ05DRAFT_385043 [Pseudovirgaria hyperparasitica]
MPPPRIPPLLHPYVSLAPPDSLTLLTSVLGASTNWLILRYILGAFDTKGKNGDEAESSRLASNGDVKVVLVSFLRDWDFWRTEARRSVGLDLTKLGVEGRFAFVDGLGELFLREDGVVPASASVTVSSSSPSGIPGRAPLAVTQNARGLSIRGKTQSALAQSSAEPSMKPKYIATLTSPDLAHVEQTIQSALSSASSSSPSSPPSRTLLILDDPSILLSATLTPVHAFLSSLLHIRTLAASSIISLPADSPLVHLTHTPTPLEREHANLVVGLGHTATRVVGLRLLDSGVARDVSGVLCVGRGGAWDGDDEESGRENGVNLEKELLYYVGGDGGVKVFERGAGTNAG